MPRTTGTRDIAERCFDAADQHRFAELSGDWNPLHVDAQAARRTMFGQPIVHGVHLLLWSLDAWAGTDSATGVAALDVRLLKPAYLSETIALDCTEEEGRITLTCRTGGAQLCAVRITPQPRPAAAAEPWQPAPRSRADAAIDLAMADLPGRAGSTPLDATAADLAAMFPQATRLLGAQRVAALLGLTRLVGMECPGLHSIFSSIDVRLDGDDGNRIDWRVDKANPRLSIVTLGVAGGGIRGSLRVFYRPPPQAQSEAAAIAAAVLPGAMANRRALIVGGSRGLGRTLAAILSAGGADVAITYRSGREDAESAAAMIAAMGARARIAMLDTESPDAAVAALAAQGFVPDEIYYFATPQIFVRKKALFEDALFEGFVGSYVTGMLRTVRAAQTAGAEGLRVFVPSSEALDAPIAELFEYSVAKAAAETCATLLARFDPSVSVVIRRLPRLPTDQTATLIPVDTADPIATLIEVCAAMGPARKPSSPETNR